MASPFVAEIRIFGCNFAPREWAQCNGQLLPISQNFALFALLGTFYGGDGKSTFALPNLMDSAPMDAGSAGGGLSDRVVGEQGGSQTVTLIESEMPSHTHTMNGANAFGASNDAAARLLSRPFGGGLMYKASGTLSPWAVQAISVAGGSLPHNNMQPYLVLNFCIAMAGVFPPRQ